MCIRDSPESGEEFVIFDGGRHGYDNMFCDEHDPAELKNRPLKRLSLIHIYLSKRRVAILCAEGRVPGAEKKANVWLIPDDAETPVDARIKSGKDIKNVKPNK